MYLVSLPHLLHSYLAGLICVVLFAISGTLAITSGVALLFRLLDQRPVLRWLYSFGCQSDVERAFVPAFLGFLVWAGLTFCAYFRESAWGVRRRRFWQKAALFFSAATALIAVASLLGTGDIHLPALTWSQQVEVVQVQHLLTLLLPLLLLIGLLPYLRPKELIRSATHPRRPYERWVFKIASYALLGGIPLFLLGWLAQENISGFNESPPNYGRLSAEHIAFTKWPTFLETIRFEAGRPRGESGVPEVPSEYLLSRSISNDPDLALLSDRILKGYGEFWTATAQRWWWWAAGYPLKCLWDPGPSPPLPVPQPQKAREVLRQLDADRDAFLQELNGRQYLESPDFARLYFPDLGTSDDAERRAAWRRAELYGAALRANTPLDDELLRKTQGQLRLANWELLRLHFGSHIVHPPEAVFAYVVTRFGGGDQSWRLWVFWVSLMLFLGSGYLVNLNRSSMHNFYRDRLDKAWLCRPMQGPDDETSPQYSDLPLAKLQTSASGLPYLLINCTLNFFGDKYYRRWFGAAADPEEEGNLATASFLFSQRYCGSSALGFEPTEEYANGQYDLANAMAVSGAAVSPALSGNWLVVFLLFVSNFRLGQWLDNPGRGKPRGFWLTRRRRFGPAPLPVLLDQLFSRAKDREFCFVTDGGHHENLGITPLLERRCRMILVSDAGADPEDKFSEWLKVVHRCRIDHGIRFDAVGRKCADESDPNVLLRGIATDPLTNVSPDHYVVARILYPASAGTEATEGYLVYMKATFTGDEDCELTQYRRSNPEFPHDPVIDQFYDEDKFEAYRRLGYHVGIQTCRDLFPTLGADSSQPVLSRWTPKHVLLRGEPEAGLLPPDALGEKTEAAAELAAAAPSLAADTACQRLLDALADERRPEVVLQQVESLTAYSLDPASLSRLFAILVKKLQSAAGDHSRELLVHSFRLASSGIEVAIREGRVRLVDVGSILQQPREWLTAAVCNPRVEKQLRLSSVEALRSLGAASEGLRHRLWHTESSEDTDRDVKMAIENLLWHEESVK